MISASHVRSCLPELDLLYFAICKSADVCAFATCLSGCGNCLASGLTALER